MNTYDAVFFVSVGTLVIGFFGLVIKYCLKSKCENVQLSWGLIKIKRRVDLETDIEIHEIDVNSKDAQSPQELSSEFSLEEQGVVDHPKKPQRGRKRAYPKFSYPRKDLPLQATNLTPPMDPPTRSESNANLEP